MEREYDYILTAALLHDIGKFVQRGQDEKKTHSFFSGAFVENFKSSFFQPDLIKTLVTHHHEAQNTPDDENPSSISDERTKLLAFLVSQADNLSSSERSLDSHNQGYKVRLPLDSVFAQVDIGNKGKIPKSYKYKLGRLLDASAYPQDGIPAELDIQDFENHLEYFNKEFNELFAQPFEDMNTTLLALIQKYCWCIPSDTTKEIRDVSLSEHAKGTCAIAACLYKYMEEKGWDKKTLKEKEQMQFVCGDISGIQNYIYEIADIGAGEVAKRLRARSFRISLLTEAIALRLLKKLDLPTACRIMAAGGQFFLLIPNTDNANEIIDSEIKEITKWMLDEYTGELSISIGKTKVKNDELSQGKFDDVIERVRLDTAENKAQKYSDILKENQILFNLNYSGQGACKVCDRQPASKDDEPCKICELDARIGKALANQDNKWLIFSTSKSEDSIPLFDDWFVSIEKDEHKQRNEFLRINIRDSKLGSLTASMFSPYAGYIPRYETQEEYDYSVNKRDEEPGIDNAVNYPKSFSRLARESEGAKLLGVLRADVDNLGMVFTIGLRGLASLSRVATLSSFMQVFFCWEIPRIIEKDFRDTYIAYTGGDDLMLLGPWEQMIDLAEKVKDKLAEFAGYNPNITISAGIGSFTSKTPIAITSRMTGDILELSKSNGRNRITFFRTTIPWDEMPKLREWAIGLCKSMDENNKKPLSKAFLYRLLGYQEMAAKFFSGNNQHEQLQNVMYRPHLSYDIARNFSDDDEIRDNLVSLISSDEETWNMLLAPITWCSYKTRKES